MYPNSRYVGLEVVSLWALWGRSILYLCTWGLGVLGLGFRGLQITVVQPGSTDLTPKAKQVGLGLLGLATP